MSRAGLALLLLGALAPAQEARLATIPAPEHSALRQVLAGDVDGDGLEDLVASGALEGDRYARRLYVFRRAPGPLPFGPAPWAELALPPDATAYALGDVHADPGAEVVLFSARGAYAWRTAREGAGRVVALAAAEFLWQLPDRRGALAWPDGVRDLNGDGLPDLCLPGPEGYFLAFQERDPQGNAAFGGSLLLRLPAGDETEAAELVVPGKATGRRALRARMAPLMLEAGLGREPLLTVEEALPAARFLDWNADGRLDLVCRSTARLHVWPQGAGGFDPRARIDLEAPVVADRARRLDLSYSAHAADLDGDGRADCVLLAGDQRSRRTGTQVLVFRQGPWKGLFGERGLPDQLLVLAGFARFPELADVDGDGRPDLAVTTFRPDAIDLLRSARTEEVDTELLVFLNRGGAFSTRPDLAFPVRLQARNLGEPGGEAAIAFIGDIDGDGVRELLVRDRPDRVRLFSPLFRGGALSMSETPVWEMALSRHATLHPSERSELLVVEPGQIVHARFR